jgi:hypothetical protein
MIMPNEVPHMSLWTPCGLLDSSGLLRTPCRFLINRHTCKEWTRTPCGLLVHSFAKYIVKHSFDKNEKIPKNSQKSPKTM